MVFSFLELSRITLLLVSREQVLDGVFAMGSLRRLLSNSEKKDPELLLYNNFLIQYQKDAKDLPGD